MTLTDARNARRAVAAMFAANGFVTGAWAPQIPLLLSRHRISEFTLGLLIIVLGLGAVTAMMFAGRLIARLGTRAMLRACALAVVPVLPLVVLAPSLWVLVPGMALFGAMIGCMDVAMNANAVEVERRLGRAIMSSSHGFWSLGGFAGGTAGASALVHWGAEGQALAAAGGALVVILIALPFLRGEPPQPAPAAGGAHGRDVPRAAGIWLLGAMALCSMVPEGAVLDWAAIYLGQELGAGTVQAGLGFALFSGAMAVVRFAGDGLRNRFGAVRTLRVSGLVGAAGLMLGALAPTAPVAVAGFALAGFGVANMVPILFSAAGNWPGQAAGRAISAVTMVGYAGILVAPGSIGFVAGVAGFRPTYAGLALLLVGVALLAGRTAMADARRAVAPAA